MTKDELKIRIAEIESMEWSETLDAEHRDLCAKLDRMQRPARRGSRATQEDRQLQRDVERGVEMLKKTYLS